MLEKIGGKKGVCVIKVCGSFLFLWLFVCLFICGFVIRSEFCFEVLGERFWVRGGCGF